MTDLAILCPTRARPETCRRMIESALAHSGADLLLYVDSDDGPSHSLLGLRSDRVQVVIATPQGRGGAVNHLCEKFQRYRMYLVVSDDIVFVRDGWESQAKAAMDSFGDDIGLVHLESEIAETYANWCVVSRRWIDTLGWFNYPECRWFCQDTIIQALATALDRIRFIRPQVLRHDILHTPDVLDRLRHDQDAFLWYMAGHFGRDLAKLREAINATVPA